MATSINQADFVKTALRLPPEVHAKVHEMAKASGRSYNAEIVARLQASFESAPETLSEVDAALSHLRGMLTTAIVLAHAVQEEMDAVASAAMAADLRKDADEAAELGRRLKSLSERQFKHERDAVELNQEIGTLEAQQRLLGGGKSRAQHGSIAWDPAEGTIPPLKARTSQAADPRKRARSPKET